jgi:hypothetical protein
VKLAGGLEKCLDALVLTWQRGLEAAPMLCPRCRFPRLDEGDWVKVHVLHTCQDCHLKHKVEPKVVGNPLAAVLTSKVIGRTLGAPPKL